MGEPTIRGMRITVSVILRLLAGGMTSKKILGLYPELEAEDIRQALKYAAWLSSERSRPVPIRGVGNA